MFTSSRKSLFFKQIHPVVGPPRGDSLFVIQFEYQIPANFERWNVIMRWLHLSHGIRQASAKTDFVRGISHERKPVALNQIVVGLNPIVHKDLATFANLLV